MAKDYVEIVAPREGVNDDVAHVVRWLAEDGSRVEAEQIVVVLETTKAAFDLTAPQGGYLFHLARAGTDVTIGAAVAVVSERPERPAADSPQATGADAAAGPAVSKRAKQLIAEHGLSLSQFAGLAAIRESDVAALLKKTGPQSKPANRFAGEELDASADWDSVLQTASHEELQGLLRQLRRRLRAKFNRHVPLGTLLNDRWNVAHENEFGEGTSVYDECLILGRVIMGKGCWVGPFTILDASMGVLTIGDNVDIGSGTHIYTHNSIERALTGRRAPVFGNNTTIGSCCFIAPHVTIGAGTVLGDHTFVAAGSYVEGKFESHSYLAGNPARVVGTVEIRGDRARVRPFGDGPHGPDPRNT